MKADQNFTTATAGLKIIQQFPIKHGKIASGVLNSGPFSIIAQTYKFIIIPSQLYGRVLINGSPTHDCPWPENTYSLIRPRDCISGSLEVETNFEVLSLCPMLLHRFICDEFAENKNISLQSCLGQDMPLIMQSIWKRLRTSMEAKQPPTGSSVELCVELLITTLVEQRQPSANTLAAGDNITAVNKAVHHIQRNLSETLDLKSIAKASGLSPFYFSRIFKVAYGVTVHRFVLERRLELASRLLKQDQLPISSIALEAGFSSQSHMTTAFRLRYGITPAAFRQQFVLDRSTSQQTN